jgi:serine phosphatase RsbU (regulator of sigma subunit)
MSQPLKILVVEDSEDDTILLLRELRRGDYEPAFERVDTPGAMRAALDRQPWDVVVADFSMPRFNALAALEVLKEKGLDVPFIIVSGTIGEELAVQAMRNGAQDYIMKGNLTRLVPAVQRELREAVERRERKRAEDALRETEEQFRVAREIQQRLFPKVAPRFGPFEIAGASAPAEATGGDYFDYLPMADACLGIVVADVTGHGVGPALLMAETRAYLRTIVKSDPDLGKILTRANKMLADDIDFERYVTLMLVKLDARAKNLTYINAGHPTAYVLNEAGEVKALLKRTGAPLGVQQDTPYAAATAIDLSPGDLVLIPTDGMEEAISPNNELFGTDRLLDVAREHRNESAREILDALFSSVRDFSKDQPQSDD